MSWSCINCETVCPDAQHSCEVCGCERFFTIAEVKSLLERSPDSKPSELEQELKKISANYKRSQTNQKKMVEEHKQAQIRISELEGNKKLLIEKIVELQTKLNKRQDAHFRTKIILFAVAVVTFILLFMRVSISILFQ